MIKSQLKKKIVFLFSQCEQTGVGVIESAESLN